MQIHHLTFLLIVREIKLNKKAKIITHHTIDILFNCTAHSAEKNLAGDLAGNSRICDDAPLSAVVRVEIDVQATVHFL